MGRGNQKVYAEIGLAFARYLENCSADLRLDAENIGRFCAALRPGAPPDGQQYLRQAFGRYYQAMFETDAKNRAEYVLLANIEIGFHEQTRLQPEIAEALNASVVDPRAFARRFVTALFPYSGWLILGGWFFLRLLNRPSRLDAAIDRFLNQVREKIRLLLTDHLMELRFPHGQRLHLGRDLNGEYPPALKHLTYPDLRALLEKIDPTPDSLIESGARDWADLPDRMHFIADLFRCYQERTELLEPPFSAEQVADMKSGRLPVGPL